MKKFLTSVIVVALLLSLVCFAACSKETSFEKVVKCAQDMQDFMVELEDFESFEIDDECGYKLGYDDYPLTVFISFHLRQLLRTEMFGKTLRIMQAVIL